MPLLTTPVIAAAVGLGVALSIISSLVPKSVHVVYPDLTFYLLTGAGIIAAILIILTTLPLLARLTSTDNARFE